MDNKLLKRLQKVTRRVNADTTEVAHDFISALKKTLAKRGYRADLKLSTDARNTSGRFTASIRFDKQLGYPTEKDLMTIIAQSYPTHEIDWELANVDQDVGLVLLSLEPSIESIPVKDLNSIPPDFKPIGTGLYKRAVDSTGNVNEIWTLRKDDNGLMLYRNNDDLEIKAEEEGFKAGDVVDTPNGPGRIVRFDEVGNAFVQVGNKKHLVAATELKKFDIDKEKKMLETYYENAYGSKDYAAQLVGDPSTMFGKDKKRK